MSTLYSIFYQFLSHINPSICFAVSNQDLWCCLFTSSTISLISSFVRRHFPANSLIRIDIELKIGSYSSILQLKSVISSSSSGLYANSGLENRPDNTLPALESYWLKGSYSLLSLDLFLF